MSPMHRVWTDLFMSALSFPSDAVITPLNILADADPTPFKIVTRLIVGLDFSIDNLDGNEVGK